MRQARSNFDRKRRSEPSSSFIIISLSFGDSRASGQEERVTGLVTKKIQKGHPP
jgi:hypothetical protein